MQCERMLKLPTVINVHSIQSGFPDASIQTLDIARLDHIHPIVSGNKIFKLKYNIDAARAAGMKGIITMGGAWSNHLAATAIACAAAGLKCIGLVRGEVTDSKNTILKTCTENAMELLSIAREAFHKDSSQVKSILAAHPDYFFIPAGGDNNEGEKGCSEILSLIPNAGSYSHIFCAMGTGTTFRGLVQSAGKHQKVIGIPVLKIRTGEQSAFMRQHGNANGACEKEILYGFAGKGYGKSDEALLESMRQFYEYTKVPTDFVYTGKLMRAIHELLKNDLLPKDARMLVMHTGGLLGNRSLKNEIFHWD